MSECNHKWKKEPFAGSIKCLKCGHVEFDVAGECLSLQERAEAAEAQAELWEERAMTLLDSAYCRHIKDEIDHRWRNNEEQER